MRGFSLVELSIVLVILGLLTGGILAGQSLIRAAELRAVGTEFDRYYTAAHSFRDKYFLLPGDISNGTAFWGRLSTTSCVTNSSAAVNAATGVCDGNANNQVEAAGAVSTSGEAFQFWRELAAAGMIEGTYSGLAGSAATNDSTPGTNVPRSKASNGGWGVEYSVDGFAGDAARYALNYGNYFVVGGLASGGKPTAAIFKPEEAWNLDTKMDDGKPGTGKIIARFWNNACATSTANNDFTGAYKLSDSSAQCSLTFRNLF